MGFAEKFKEYRNASQNLDAEEFSADSREPESSLPTEIVLIKPECFGDACGIVDHIVRSHTVVLNLEVLSREVSRRLLDFLGGAAYSRDARIEQIACTTYLITPYNVDFLFDTAPNAEGELFF